MWPQDCLYVGKNLIQLCIGPNFLKKPQLSLRIYLTQNWEFLMRYLLCNHFIIIILLHVSYFTDPNHIKFMDNSSMFSHNQFCILFLFGRNLVGCTSLDYLILVAPILPIYYLFIKISMYDLWYNTKFMLQSSCR